MQQPRWMDHAWSDLGVEERPGSAHERRILDYFRDAGHAGISDDETAWCAAFVGACLERSGVRSTRSLAARSYQSWGEAADPARPGAIAVLSRGSDPSLGHVGFLLGETDDSVILLGGNQGDRVSVASFSRDRLLGVRWPADAIHPPAAPAPDGGAGFDRALALVLEFEGGWTDDPYDPGGPTNKGITLAEFARFKRREVSAATLADLKAALRAISPADLRAIYEGSYWRPARCPDLPPPVALFHFDAAVNQGVGTAARMLQEAAGADIDGEIGPQTLAAVTSSRPAELVARYADIRRRRYRALPHFWRFGKGWLRRTDAALAAAVALPPAGPQLPPGPKEDQPAMPDLTTKPADPKWWGESLTVWGALITAVSTVLPAFGPLVGIDVSADLARQLGEQFVHAAQAVAGLFGTAMTIYGRVRATQPLERRPMQLKL